MFLRSQLAYLHEHQNLPCDNKEERTGRVRAISELTFKQNYTLCSSWLLLPSPGGQACNNVFGNQLLTSGKTDNSFCTSEWAACVSSDNWSQHFHFPILPTGVHLWIRSSTFVQKKRKEIFGGENSWSSFLFPPFSYLSITLSMQPKIATAQPPTMRSYESTCYWSSSILHRTNTRD